ncbi:MAG: SDR family oxidoreductase [Chloroflexota bacterium]|nr:SDR family oxidoreductase [Chloroflexota bacterium]
MERPKVVLITGASTGIGRATAIEMRGRGWRVFATVRRQTDVVDLTKVGRGLIEPLIMDVTKQEEVDRAIGTIRERAGRLDALVNNAGIAVAGPLETLPVEELRRQFEVNVFGLHRVTRATLPLLRESRGRIVNISSAQGQDVIPFAGPYAASKHAVEALSDALRLELHGVVKVIVIQPGSVKTPIWEKTVMEDYSVYVNEHYPEEEIERLTRLYWKVGQRGIEPKAVAVAIGNALELPWPLPRWPVVARNRLPLLALRFLPTVLKDWLKRKALRWPPEA